jgi:hypothetical protein
MLLIALVVVGCGSKHEAAHNEARLAGDPALCDTLFQVVEDGPFIPFAGDSTRATATGEWGATRDGECERVSLALLRGDGAPQHPVVPLRGGLLRSYGIVRVAIPGAIDAIADPDTAIASPLVTAAYVVHARDGSYYVDIHLAQPALARLIPLARPARIGIDLSPGGGAVPTRAPRARNVVVLEPRAGAVTYPLKIRGYARTFEANVIARLSFAGKVARQTHGTAADYATTWGDFELTIPKGPSGDVDLFVGEDSAADGTPVGVTIPLHFP